MSRVILRPARRDARIGPFATDRTCGQAESLYPASDSRRQDEEACSRPSRGGVLYQDSTTRLADITDGTSNTLLLGERPPSADFQFGWWYAGVGQLRTGSAEMVLGVREPNLQPVVAGSACGPGRYPFRPASGFGDPCGMFHFWSPHSGGANFAFVDGGVRFLSYSANPLMPFLASRSAGEVAELVDLPAR